MTVTREHETPAPLVTLPQVAERLGVNERHIRRLVAERRIPFVKWVTCFGSTRSSSRSGSKQHVSLQHRDLAGRDVTCARVSCGHSLA
jgi:excisionase family DNA binding protein